MKNKKLAAIPLLVAVALSILGFVYAHWSDIVYIEGTVHMGELIVGILPESVSWNETTNGVREEDFDPPKPWVANTTITLSDEETSVHHEPPETVYKTMNITMDNAYPQYDVHIRFKLKNAGTIPASVGFDNNAPSAINIKVEGLSPTQLEPCTSVYVEITIELRQIAEECHTYTFQIKTKAIQWNKA